MIKRLSILILAGLCLSIAACTTIPSISSPIQRINVIRAAHLPKVNQQLAAANLEPGAHVYIRIFKEERVLEAWLRNEKTGRYQPYKSYPVCSYSGLLGPKLREGDKQSPEGFYDITEDRLWPGSQYHLAMNIGFPNEYDQAHGRTGSFLMIHGGCESAGCYAMTDPAIEEIYLLTEQSLAHNSAPVPVHIFPFRMTDKNLARYAASPQWLGLWNKLKEGYDAFEQSKVPPQIFIDNGNYIVQPQVFVKRHER